MKTAWTTPSDLRLRVQKLWDQGRLLGAMVEGDALFPPLFPIRLPLKVPSSTELSDRFDDVRVWARELQQVKGVRLVMREVRHRVIGSNALPQEAWVDCLDDALALIGKARDAARFATLIAETRERQPQLMPWLAAQALRALALADEWSRLIDFVDWLRMHPRPGIYLREVDLAGIHSKFVEQRRVVLSELLDRALPENAIDGAYNGTCQFARRYGFRSKPMRVRLRVLDPRQALLAGDVDQDITMTHLAFSRLDPAAKRIFITENETNFLAFPPLPDSLVVFGAGYGVQMLADAAWLNDRTLHYWGDIDTHGFAILDQLRGRFAHVESLLMDRATLMAHRPQWTDEPEPTLRDLPRLTPEERAVFDDLRWKRIDDRCVRLEQERVGFGWVEEALEAFRRLN